jgi:hypothetical protein
MSEPTTQGNGDAGQTLAPVSLLAAVSEVLKALDHFEQNVPQTPAWMKNENKCEVSLGVLRKLRQAANAGTQRPGTQGAEPANPDAQPGSLK